VQGRTLLDAFSSVFIEGEGVSDILDSTSSAAVAIFPAESQGRRFFLAASGSYPRFMANFSLIFSRGWRRQRSVTGNSYWHSANENIALALGSNLALVSDTDPYDNFAFETPPSGFAEFNRGYALAGWVNDSSDSINAFLSSMGIPLQVPAEDFFFGALNSPANFSSPNPDSPDQGPVTDWELVFRIGTSSTAQARSLLTLFSMARLFVMRGPQAAFPEDPFSMNPQDVASLLFANTPEQDGNALLLRIGPLDEGRIALLFSMFSVYSS
jgi:hypothetical protein